MKPLIIAPHYAHADLLARDIGLHPQGWAYISRADQLRGRGRGEITFVCIDTAYEMRDWDVIENALAWNGFQRCDISLDAIRGIRR